MLEKKKVYVCKHCGNVIEGLWNAKGTHPSCCGDPMTLQEPGTTDAATEKHVPVVKRDGNKVTVTIGEVDHPMAPEHYILFVEVLAGDKVLRHDFKEGDAKAEAVFLVEDGPVIARAYCNLHGLWSAEG